MNQYRVLTIIIASRIVLNLRDIVSEEDLTIATYTASPFGTRRSVAESIDDLEIEALGEEEDSQGQCSFVDSVDYDP